MNEFLQFISNASGAGLALGGFIAYTMWRQKRGNGFSSTDREHLTIVSHATKKMCEALEKHDLRAVEAIVKMADSSAKDTEILREIRDMRLEMARMGKVE